MTDLITDAAVLPAPARDLTFSDARARYQGLVFAFVARRVRPVEEAEDIVAAVFVDAFRHWRKRRGDTRLWLLGIARRKIADAFRRKRTPWPLYEADLTANAMDEFVTQAQANQAIALIAQLPIDERDALLMSVVDELTIAEIAEVLGRSEKAANSLLGRARTRVRRLATSQGDGQ